jgi:hypothetical protein
VAVVWCRGELTAAQGFARRGERAVVLGFRGGCDGKGRAQGGVTGPNKGEDVGLGVRTGSTAEIAAGNTGRADRATASRNPGLWGSASRR